MDEVEKIPQKVKQKEKDMTDGREKRTTPRVQHPNNKTTRRQIVKDQINKRQIINNQIKWRG